MIWFDVTRVAKSKGKIVGIVRSQLELYKALKNMYSPEELALCIWNGAEFIQVPKIENLQLKKCSIGTRIRRKFNKILQRKAKITTPFKSGDIYCTLDLNWDIASKFPSIKAQGVKVVTCCHDLIPVKMPQLCNDALQIKFPIFLKYAITTSDAILCISKTTKADLLEYIEKTKLQCSAVIEVITWGQTRLHQNQEVIRPKIKNLVSESFILYVSTVELRKGHEVLYKAYHLLGKENNAGYYPKLVIVGGLGLGGKNILQYFEKDPLLKDHYYYTNTVSDEELDYLYRNCLFTVFPSCYEGYGFPMAEAFAYNKCVISSGEGALGEIGQGLAVDAKVWDPYDWSDKIKELANNVGERRALERAICEKNRTTSWDDCAQKIKGIFQRLKEIPHD